jgi:hypothetical protein
VRGLLFTDLIDMIETQFSPAIADEILSGPGLSAGGAYTAVGVYEYREFCTLLDRLVARVNVSRSTILVRFGRYHFHKLLRLYPHMVAGVTDVFGLLDRVDHPIHSTVTSIHARAEVPQILFERLSSNQARVTYQSKRGLADVAEGILLEAAVHYGQRIEIQRTDSPNAATGSIGEHACFLLTITTSH